MHVHTFGVPAAGDDFASGDDFSWCLCVLVELCDGGWLVYVAIGRGHEGSRSSREDARTHAQENAYMDTPRSCTYAHTHAIVRAGLWHCPRRNP